MTLSELFAQLALGELKNLALAVDGDILDEEKPMIVLHANNGLNRLHTRFLLRENDLFLEQRGYKTTYELTKEHAQSQGSGASFYIMDLGSPFTGDVIKVMTVHDGYARRVPLNEPHKWGSVFTPRPTTLQIPHPVEGGPLAVHYQANHPKLLVEELDQKIELLDFLVPALTAYIAEKVFTHMNTQENTVKAQEHNKKFETICVEAVEQDLVTTGATTSGTRFEKNGWV